MLKISHQIFFILMESIPYSLDQFKFKKSFFFTFIFKKNHGIFYLRLWLTKDLLFWKHFFHVIDVFFREQRAKLFFLFSHIASFSSSCERKTQGWNSPQITPRKTNNRCRRKKYYKFDLSLKILSSSSQEFLFHYKNMEGKFIKKTIETRKNFVWKLK